jgi:dihydrofolate reductase
MVSDRKIILYIACTLDGFIAGPYDDLGFLSMVEKTGEDYGYSEFMKNIDTVIMGKRTYDWVKINAPEFIHEITTYVYTRTGKASEGNIIFYSGDLGELSLKLKNETGKNIFCEGGAIVANTMLRENLVDEFIISIIPVILGKGIRLFGHNGPELELDLVTVEKYETGLVQLHYRKKNMA